MHETSCIQTARLRYAVIGCLCVMVFWGCSTPKKPSAVSKTDSGKSYRAAEEASRPKFDFDNPTDLLNKAYEYINAPGSKVDASLKQGDIWLYRIEYSPAGHPAELIFYSGIRPVPSNNRSCSYNLLSVMIDSEGKLVGTGGMLGAGQQAPYATTAAPSDIARFSLSNLSYVIPQAMIYASPANTKVRTDFDRSQLQILSVTYPLDRHTVEVSFYALPNLITNKPADKPGLFSYKTIAITLDEEGLFKDSIPGTTFGY